MNNEMSFESLYMKGFGLEETNNNNVSFSNESYITDGFEEATAIELAQATENLKFLDAYSKITRKNASDKIRMCKKLAVNYGMKSGVNTTAAKSIENLCKIQSIEAEETNDENKKPGFWKTLGTRILNLFKAIGRFFKKLFIKARNLMKMLFTRKLLDIIDEKKIEQVKKIVKDRLNSNFINVSDKIEENKMENSFNVINTEVLQKYNALCSKLKTINREDFDKAVNDIRNSVIKIANIDENGKLKGDSEYFIKEFTGLTPTNNVDEITKAICSGKFLDKLGVLFRAFNDKLKNTDKELNNVINNCSKIFNELANDNTRSDINIFNFNTVNMLVSSVMQKFQFANSHLLETVNFYVITNIKISKDRRGVAMEKID